MIRLHPVCLRNLSTRTACFFGSHTNVRNSQFVVRWGSSYSNPNDGEMLQQQVLPKLPVPPLQQTLAKYLNSVKPLVENEEYLTTKKIVEDFQNGLGLQLQTLLEAKAKKENNWLSDWWLHYAYLANRLPLPINSSPGMIGPIQSFKGIDGQLKFAAKLIVAVMDYKTMIDNKTVPLDMQGKVPLDMSQYYKIFSTCRIPGKKSDSLVYHSNDEKPPTHICVAHNNHYFKVYVYGNDGKPLNEAQILSQLKTIIEQSVYPKSPIGVLTTGNRKTWAESYKRLSKGKLNAESIKDIQRSMFLVCLDQNVKNPSSLNHQTDAALQIIHGYGAEKGNSGNRWFDKTLQFIIGRNGEFGIAYEHSPAEGPPIANILDHISMYKPTSKLSQLPSASTNPLIRLKFDLSEETLDDINNASCEFDVMIKDIEMSCFSYDGFGKNFIKSQKLSPDSFIQMAMQLAFFKIHECVGATYETAATRQFLDGRTEVIRSASNESLAFCQAMSSNSISDQDKIAALRNAVEGHKKYTIEAINANGVDRHLMGLKLTAIESGQNVPDLFMDTSYITSTHFRISSSQVPAKSDAFMAYGPLVPDGYACCYNPHIDSIHFGTSACNSSPETYSGRFMESLQSSLTEMHDILVKNQKSKL